MALSSQAVAATVDCTVRVARDASGTLADGAETQLDRIEAVEVVDDVAVAGIEPRLNDVAVDVEAAVRVAVPADEPPDAAVEAALAAGFGVEVAAVRVEA